MILFCSGSLTWTSTDIALHCFLRLDQTHACFQPCFKRLTFFAREVEFRVRVCGRLRSYSQNRATESGRTAIPVPRFPSHLLCQQADFVETGLARLCRIGVWYKVCDILMVHPPLSIRLNFSTCEPISGLPTSPRDGALPRLGSGINYTTF
jgi:hypothetical protein